MYICICLALAHVVPHRERGRGRVAAEHVVAALAGKPNNI